MGVFDKDSAYLKTFFEEFSPDDWVKWKAVSNEFYDDCDKFNGCFFIYKQMPAYPQHLKCKCQLEKIHNPIPNKTAFAYCDIKKFTEYVFNPAKNNGKFDLFTKMGYNIKDSQALQELFAKQGLKKYCNGDYIFKGTGNYNIRIEIKIGLPTQNGIASIKTGWSLKPNGLIVLVTPFSGYAK